MPKLAKSLLFGPALALQLSACALSPGVTHMAVEYNQFVAEATDRQTIINVLRARDREPLHFTSFTKLDGSAQVESTAGFGPTFNGTATEKTGTAGILAVTKKTLNATSIAPTLGIKVDAGTDFEIAINSTDDFWKGILGPVSPTTVAYYLREGWRADLISYLFIDAIDFSVTVKDADGKPVLDPTYDPEDKRPADFMAHTVSNTPSNPDAMTEFNAVLKCRMLISVLESEDEKSLPVADPAKLSGVSAEILGQLQASEKNGPPPQPYAFVTPAHRDFAMACPTGPALTAVRQVMI